METTVTTALTISEKDLQGFSFEDQQFDVIINGEPYFIGQQVANILGYENGSRDVNRHVDKEDRQVITRKDLEQMASSQETTKTVLSLFGESAVGGVQRLTIINESGLYSLILKSKLPTAKKFKRWVTNEVLPSIKMEKSLVSIQNNQVVVSSRDIAEHFKKDHKHVLESIKKLLSNQPAENSTRSISTWFCETMYVDQKGEQRKEYLMNRDGFSLLVMGFTGQKALEWKVKYIEAFNKMEEQLRGQQKTMTPLEMLSMQVKILEEQEKKLQALKLSDDKQSARLTAVEQKLVHPISGVLRKEEEHDIKLKDHEERIIDIEHMFRDEGPTEEIICLIKDVVNNCNYSYDNAYKGFYTFLRKQGIDVYARQANLKRRAERAGWTKSQVKQISVLDAIKRSPDTWDKVRSAIALVRENLDMED